MASLYKGFIFPNISDPYVYLKTLNTDHNVIANRVGNAASGILSNINSNIEQEHINKGLLFKKKYGWSFLFWIVNVLKPKYDVTLSFSVSISK